MKLSEKVRLTKFIKSKSADLGFTGCGISKAEFLEEQAPLLERWLSQGSHGQMAYMEKHFDKRLDPRKLFPGAKSVISFTLNYYPEKDYFEDQKYKVSRYAYGRDYHKVLKKKIKSLWTALSEEAGDIAGRIFVDSAPVMDKVWAEKAGLGWIGKHTNLIKRNDGSYFFIAEIITDLELIYEEQTSADYCGRCTKCIDACPTNAITPYQVDGSKCISYLTIELKEQIPDHFKGRYKEWVFGCDICQEVCPWNRFAKTHNTEDFQPKEAIKNFSDKEWEELTEDVFEEFFKGSPLKRAGFKGLKRNIDFVKE